MTIFYRNTSLKYFFIRKMHINNNVLLGHYLAGLIEGDGSIITPKSLKNEKGKLLYPKIKITFVDKYVPLAKKIKEVIDGGTIVKQANYNYSELLFQYLKTIKKIILLINGKMRTPKIIALHNIMEF